MEKKNKRRRVNSTTPAQGTPYLRALVGATNSPKGKAHHYNFEL